MDTDAIQGEQSVVHLECTQVRVVVRRVLIHVLVRGHVEGCRVDTRREGGDIHQFIHEYGITVHHGADGKVEFSSQTVAFVTQFHGQRYIGLIFVSEAEHFSTHFQSGIEFVGRDPTVLVTRSGRHQEAVVDHQIAGRLIDDRNIVHHPRVVATTFVTELDQHIRLASDQVGDVQPDQLRVG